MGGYRVPLAAILDNYRPGSFDATGWSWDDEAAELLSRECLCAGLPPQPRPCGTPGHYQLQLEEHLRCLGRVEQGILLGNDGRVWDGHHRIVAARRLGFTDMPLEVDSFPLMVRA